MNVLREKTTKQLLAKFMLIVIFAIMGFFLSSVLLPGNQGEALAAEPFDSLAEQAVSNSYSHYIETGGKIISSSLDDLDSYSIYILTEANVSVDQWVYGESRLKTTVINLIDDTIENEADESLNVNAKYVAYQYLAAKGLGEDALAQKLLEILQHRQENNGDGTFFNGAWSQWTNLPVFDALCRVGALGQTDVEKGIDYILSLKAGDYFSDFMSTTQAIRSLSALKAELPKYRTDEIETAINEGLAWLKGQIKEDGSVVYVGDGWSDDVVTDTAESILTLVALGQDPHSWQHKDTKKSPVDYMKEKAKNSEGTFGSGNMGANTWALDAFNCLGAIVVEDTDISSGGGGGSSRPSENKVRVEVAVTGEKGEKLFSGRVNLDKKKATVFETLAKTDLNYEGDSYFITAIEGQKNQGMNGWMVKVNGKFIATSIGDYTLRTGDSVEWLYSTDSSNIVGIGGKAGGSGSDSLSSEKNSEVEKSVEEILTELLAQGDELKVNLQKIVNQQAFFSPQLLTKVMEQEKSLQLETERMQISFAPSSLWTEQLSKIREEENTWLNLGAKALSAAEKKEIIEGALRQGCGLEDIGAQVVELKAEIVRTEEKGEAYTETITGFHEPVQITFELSGLEIAEEEANLLTAVRYEKDRWGNLRAVKLGGTYDATSGKFTFYTENFSLYSVVKAEDLLKIMLAINEEEVLINDTKKKVDVPACLIENRTMVPLRFVAEGMGAEVQWQEGTRTVEMHFQDKLLKLVVGKTGPGLEVPAMIEEGRTLVPLRYVVNYLGATVTWFPATQTVMIVR
ncbi:MAG: stalk domain-containing protein [Peptococcia bacterium]|jgi:hypothetical protein